MGEMRLTVRHTGKGNGIECTTPRGLTMTFDGSEGAHGPTPMEHLLAALGACSLMDVEVILRKKRLSFSDLRVDLVGERREEGEVNPFVGMRLVFRVAGDVPQKAFDDACRLSVEKYCSVGATLQKQPPVAWEAVVG